MKAIILSAGRGTRLLPLTTDIPKCLIPVAGERPLLEIQLATLAACGVRQATVMVGFEARRVEAFLRGNPVPGMCSRTIYNPFYAQTENLVTCWLAQPGMHEDFVFLNGDTLFEPALLERLLASPPAPLTLAIDKKAAYDDDDMKVSLNGGRRLRAVSKTLDSSIVDGESIGMMVFRGEGPRLFRSALAQAIRSTSALSAWYLSVVEQMAQRVRVETESIAGLWWQEIDTLSDLAEARAALDPVHTAESPLLARIPPRVAAEASSPQGVRVNLRHSRTPRYATW
jgi:choline kinase